MEAYYRYSERENIDAERHMLGDIYYGAEYDDEYIKQALQKTGWLAKARRLDAVEGEVGELISKGKIIARFGGRDEWGPRALGNRSIIADPRDMRVIRKINFAIKQRDFWMPFAPSVLEERAVDYFIKIKPARYMIEAFDTTERADEITAGLHPYDRTGRPHMVNEWNPSYRKILQAFQGITGVGGVLNTSFNIHGYPIVGTPEIALATLENSGLDGLAAGNWLVQKQ